MEAGKKAEGRLSVAELLSDGVMCLRPTGCRPTALKSRPRSPVLWTRAQSFWAPFLLATVIDICAARHPTGKVLPAETAQTWRGCPSLTLEAKAPGTGSSAWV